MSKKIQQPDIEAQKELQSVELDLPDYARYATRNSKSDGCLILPEA